MLGAYDFCGHYEWTFEWLRRIGGESLLREYWDQAISQDSQRHAAALIVPQGIPGMIEYWDHTLDQEAADIIASRPTRSIASTCTSAPRRGS